MSNIDRYPPYPAQFEIYCKIRIMNKQLADSVHQCLVMPCNFNTNTVHYKGSKSKEYLIGTASVPDGSGAVCDFGPFEPGSESKSFHQQAKKLIKTLIYAV
jgi:hypothetical protein